MVLHVLTHLAKKKVAILKQKQHSTPAYWIFHQDPEKELTFPGSGSYLKRKGSPLLLIHVGKNASNLGHYCTWDKWTSNIKF